MGVAGVKVRVRVKPNARMSSLEERGDGTWLACVKASPVDGKANEEVIALVARRFGVRRTQVSIRSGAAARTKLIEVDG
jgi:uncharacterized protein (TIGR00251 family)